MNANAAELLEAVKGWQDSSPEAVRRRKKARARAWAIANGKPWQIDHLAAEVEHLWGTDKASNICRRLHYGKPESLVKRLYNNSYTKLAAKLDRALRAEAGGNNEN